MIKRPAHLLFELDEAEWPLQRAQNPAVQHESYMKKVAERMPDVGRKMEYMLNTGNLVSKSGLDLSQNSGFTVVAEKLNFFRCRAAAAPTFHASMCMRLSLLQMSMQYRRQSLAVINTSS